VPPEEFLPLAERSGLMHLVTDRLVMRALSQLADWRLLGLSVPVTMNVALSDLLGGRLGELILTGLSRYGLPPAVVQLEIDERALSQHSDELTTVLGDLDALGVTISLDDFGTGYSSLLRLETLPVREIKIDRAFVGRIGESSSAAGIVRAIADLAHALGMRAVAEGVETVAEWRQLRELGCDGAQGWHIAAPMSAGPATEWLLAHQDARQPVLDEVVATVEVAS
jgi:EAL domain-containing protein (putative c-di-GMP-specific phosphodiesterase class I)